MKALLYGAVCAFGLLGAVGAQAHDHGYRGRDWDGRGWHDGGWHDRGWHRGWERGYRPYGYRYYGYAPRYCPPRYGAWRESYYEPVYPRYRSYDYPRADAEVVLSFPIF